MPSDLPVKIGPLKESEVPEADRIMRLAFGTFLGLPDPMAFMGDRNFMVPRFHAKHVKVLGARLEARLIGVVAATRWGSFGFFGPLVVLPEFWDKGVAQRLLEPTVKLFDRWGCATPASLPSPTAPNTSACIRNSATGPRILRRS